MSRSAHHHRPTCSACHATLPRAAFHRCPLCREPIPRAADMISIVCRRCDRPIPRAHAGDCPHCVVANRPGGMALARGARR